ncbi:hypothetical protein GWI33_015842 [Rhynchophorus ferrugineus]|uniref:Uncharacterized protein n=1 Tax=Rhynchophorus ferrugineus TaxID=354439 RepID=A0A834MB06_RHYFE|nr:hypothetical protein GWI33_015842 [Rhynchophorus ferrugineus]
MLTIIFMLWSLIRNITRTVTARTSSQTSLTTDEATASNIDSLPSHSVNNKSGLEDMGQLDGRRTSVNIQDGVYTVVQERRRISINKNVDDRNPNGNKESEEVSQSLTPSPEPAYSPTPSPELGEFLSEISNVTRMSSEGHRSRYSIYSRESSVDVGNESRPSVTSLSSYSTSSRRYEIIGQRSIDSRASVTSLWSSDMSRRDSEAIPEHEIDSSDSTRTSFASDNSRRYSEGLSKRRRSSARAAQIRRFIRRVPLTYDRRRTTGRSINKK